MDPTHGLVPEYFICSSGMKTLASLSPETCFQNMLPSDTSEACLLVPIFLICYPNVPTWPHQVTVTGRPEPLRLVRKPKCSDVRVILLHTQSFYVLDLCQQILVALWTSILHCLFLPLLVYILLCKESRSDCRNKTLILIQITGSLRQIWHLSLHHSSAYASRDSPSHSPTYNPVTYWMGGGDSASLIILWKWLGTYYYPEERGHPFVGKAQQSPCVGCSHCHKYGNMESTEEKWEAQRVSTVLQSKISVLFLFPPKLPFFSGFHPAPPTPTL